ncbi:cobaltochelatase CobT-related protein [Litchfieldella rifensis]|uniref:Cobalamin biosynthesis protein CobT n=1 Tax=Litchfieldella rifensis TaxID=762643 RepID=A0ABV7LV69_9GAMM
MDSPRQRLRRQQRLEDLEAAALRALTGDAALHYRGRRLHRGQRALGIHAPHLRLTEDCTDLAAYRGVTDGMALRLLHSDADLHRRQCPEAPVERLIFELLEQLRVESLVAAMPGMAANLQQRFTAWSSAFHHSGLTEGALGILLYSVAQICWSRLMAKPVLAETEDLIEATRAAIVPHLGTALAGLRRHRHDQAAFAPCALAIARWVGDAVRQATPPNDGDDQDETVQQGFALLLDVDDDEQDNGVALASSGHSKAFSDTARRYRVFTTAFDSEVAAGTLVRSALLEEYRERLDARIAAQGINLRRLARQFTARLSLPQRDGWRFGEEEGQLDGRRLAQLITSPAERRLFRREQYKPRADCLVSFLIDCSGSMKAHSEALAMLIDQLARALDMAGVTTEILGFTTGAWGGGRAQQEWLRRGRPRHPGRLNEVRYLVFKDAERPWRRARRDIGALLKRDLYREGIDGEAVEWACARMRGREEQRRILVVLSDGSPSDSATNLANDRFYLDNHLKEVVSHHECQGDIEILGLGVGLDLSPFYRHHLVIDLAQSLDNALCDEVAGLLTARRR